MTLNSWSSGHLSDSVSTEPISRCPSVMPESVDTQNFCMSTKVLACPVGTSSLLLPVNCQSRDMKQLLLNIVWSIIMRVNFCTYSVQIHFVMSWFGWVWKQSLWCRGRTICAFQPVYSSQNACWQQERESSLLLKGEKTGSHCFSWVTAMCGTEAGLYLQLAPLYPSLIQGLGKLMPEDFQEFQARCIAKPFRKQSSKHPAGVSQ